ncbi:MAG TPA: hypothetical protein VF765_17765 [Polyangiaceae bacterium]
MLRELAFFAVAVSTIACSSSSKPGASAGSGDAGDGGEPICILQEGGTTYDCNGQTVAACAANTQSSQACPTAMAQCTGCEMGAGFSCTCQVAGDGGLQWTCVGTEHPCR